MPPQDVVSRSNSAKNAWCSSPLRAMNAAPAPGMNHATHNNVERLQEEAPDGGCQGFFPLMQRRMMMVRENHHHFLIITVRV
jgi:hypothetical protein